MLFRWFERVFAIVLLLACMGVIDSLIRPPLDARDNSPSSSDVPAETGIVVTGVYLWGGVIVVARWRRVLNAALAAWPLLAFAVLAPISALWSVDPVLTLRRSVLVLASTLLAIYLGARYPLPKLARLLAVAMVITMLMVLALRFAAPSRIIDVEGAWRGLSPHKNAFGAYMGIAVVLFCLMRFRRFNVLRYLLVVMAGFLLFVSHSMAALTGSVLVLTAAPLWGSLRSSTERRILAGAVAVTLFALGVYVANRNPDLFFQLVARDPTFTGRTKLWSLVTPAIAQHPFLGYGYGAFWWTGLSGGALNVWIRSRWFPTAADNGYVDLLLDLGVIALPFLSFLLFRGFRLAFQCIRAQHESIALWPAAYFCFFVLNNVFESQLLTTRSLEFLLFAAIFTSLSVHHGFELPFRARRQNILSSAERDLVSRRSNASAFSTSLLS